MADLKQIYAKPLGALDNLDFADEELAAIDADAVEAGINLWAASSRH